MNLSDAHMKNLLSEKDRIKLRDAWSSPELEQQLLRRLGHNCKPYLAFVDKLNRRILKFAHKLKLGSDFNVRSIGRANY